MMADANKLKEHQLYIYDSFGNEIGERKKSSGATKYVFFILYLGVLS